MYFRRYEYSRDLSTGMSNGKLTLQAKSDQREEHIFGVALFYKSNTPQKSRTQFDHERPQQNDPF